ncbi:MAG: type I-C CRISPR-associated protein Cas8c/Csd1 [Candidatus Accumulibacter sp.]|jgi:CRISPR-associated protein Csd1|nr:type I-C CRISPR-associated protein Cas8c/Csd1 [Accumulibacter sp.]
MILQSLARYYRRLIERGEEGIAPYGYSPEKISYEIVLAPDGGVVQVNDIRDISGKKPQPRILKVPQPEKRTVGIRSNFLWDKTSYVLGVSGTSKRADKEHEAFKALHATALADAEDAGLKALRLFLQRWSPDDFRPPMFPAGMRDANVVFRFEDNGKRTWLHDREEAQALCARLLANDGEDEAAPTAFCLVSGESATIARLHPNIKGVSGAQSSGASLVSFNLDAFTSYDKSQGDNAPISEWAAFAYTSALNYLLRRDAGNRQRLQVSDTTVVFWAETKDGNADAAHKAEGFLAAILDPPADDNSEALKIERVLDGVADGRPLEDLDPALVPGTQMYVLGLAPSAARLSIRFWLVNTLEAFTCQLAQHRKDLRLEPSPWKTEPSVWRLTLATAPSRDGRAKSQDVPPQLAGELMRAILTGNRYPNSLLASMVMRMRADGDISGVRVAICKAVLVRNARTRSARTRSSRKKEEILVSLNKRSTESGYLLGRLFAVQENVQRAALGGAVNATIRDRYYGAASATPASIFPVLLRNTQNHLGKLRREKPGLAVNLEKDIREIFEGLPDVLPDSLKIEAQGSFAIGYYHQSQSYFAKRAENTEAAPDDNGEKPQSAQGELL